MLNEIKQNTEMTSDSGDYTIPKADCFNEDGTIDKYKYLLQFPNFTKHERKMTKKKIAKFLNTNSSSFYFRLEVQGTPYGTNFVFKGNPTSETLQAKFISELWDVVDSFLYEVKNFNYSDDNKSSLEIWGTGEDQKPFILYLYPNPHGTVEIKE